MKIFTPWHCICFLFGFSRLPCCRTFPLYFHSFILSICVLLYFVLIHCSKTTIQYSSRNLCIVAVVNVHMYNVHIRKTRLFENTKIILNSKKENVLNIVTLGVLRKWSIIWAECQPKARETEERGRIFFCIRTL